MGVGQLAVGDKTSEIPKLKELLPPLPLEDTVITANALHTQKGSARFLVEDKGAEYLFRAKDNPPPHRQDIAALHLDAFPPQDSTTEKAPGRLEIRRIWSSITYY